MMEISHHFGPFGRPQRDRSDQRTNQRARIRQMISDEDEEGPGRMVMNNRDECLGVKLTVRSC